MTVERVPGGTSLIDVLDRFDKGIVIDAWARPPGVGIDLIPIGARVVVVSTDTYLRYSKAVGQVTPASCPPYDEEDDEDDGGEGSSGASALLHTALKPRRRPGSRPQPTRRRKDD